MFGAIWSSSCFHSAQVGSGTLFGPCHLLKSDGVRSMYFPIIFVTFHPRWRPKRLKIAPRWVQDPLGPPFLRFGFWLRFGTAVGSVLGLFGFSNGPRGEVKLRVPPPWGSKTVVGSSWFGSFWTCSFGSPFWALLALRPSWGSPGSFWALWDFLSRTEGS